MSDIQNLYDNLWERGTAAFARGDISADRHLQSLAADQRDGLSLIAYLSPELHPAILSLIDDLRSIAPGQFFYVAEQLHFTVMSLIPVRQKIDLAQAGIHQYKETCREILSDASAVDVEFCGITATNSAVMIQGWPDATLNLLRDDLRKSLSAAGLGGNLDMRYRLLGAHVTLMRFASAPENLPALVSFLNEQRALEQNFGTMTLREVALVHNDYYLLPQKSEVLARFPLG
jgi:hypothetical protein